LATAATLAAALLFAAAAAASDGSYDPFVTDFPKVPTSSGAVESTEANDKAHFGVPDTVARSTASAASAEQDTSGRDGMPGGAVLLAAALLAVVAVGLSRRGKRPAIGFVLAAGIVSLTLAGVVTANRGKRDANVATPRDLVAAGWLCVDVPDNWVHCVPPGVDLENDPPASMLNLNFYTHDAASPDALFLGEETLIRADVWNALPRRWPCGKRGYGFVPAEALPPHGYMYCHHFKEPGPLRDRNAP
jgi:hypothetical protein